MPFRIDAFKSSPAVQAMHPAARSGYLYLLSCQWQSDDCTISNDQLDLAEASGLGDELWSIHSARILRKFDTVTVRSPLENDTVTVRLRNQACFLEWEKAKKVFEARQKAALDTVTVRSPRGHHSKNGRSAYTRTGTYTEVLDAQSTDKSVSALEPTPPEPGVFELPLADKTVYEVPPDLYREYVAAFPGVSVMGELARMRTWLLSNRKSMKTRKGMPRFMNTWLDKEQNRNGGKSNGKSNGNGIFDDLQKLSKQNDSNHDGDTVAPSAPRQARESQSGGSVGPRAPELW